MAKRRNIIQTEPKEAPEEYLWELLAHSLYRRECVPFLGAGASAGIFPLASEIARQFADENKYPFGDSGDLAKVTQYMAISHRDNRFPKRRVAELFQTIEVSEFINDPEQPCNILAQLPFEIYITTNYDDLMFRALQHYKKKPKWVLCAWSDQAESWSTTANSAQIDHNIEYDFKPTEECPLIFHLHGHFSVPESMVLTEDDYIEFLGTISRNKQILPPQVIRAISYNTILFLGYGLADWNFRVLYNGLPSDVRDRCSYVVRLNPPVKNNASLDSATRYYEKYYSGQNLQIFWTDIKHFLANLQARWQRAYLE